MMKHWWCVVAFLVGSIVGYGLGYCPVFNGGVAACCGADCQCGDDCSCCEVCSCSHGE